jgi:hypothetical protein
MLEFGGKGGTRTLDPGIMRRLQNGSREERYFTAGPSLDA